MSDEGAKLDKTLINLLAYLDNMVFLGNGLNTMRNLYTRLIELKKNRPWYYNEEKTEYMVASGRGEGRQTEKTLKMGTFKLKKMTQFKYLGIVITQSKNM